MAAGLMKPPSGMGGWACSHVLKSCVRKMYLCVCGYTCMLWAWTSVSVAVDVCVCMCEFCMPGLGQS